MPFEREDFSGGDVPPETVITGLVTGIVEDALNSASAHCKGLTHDIAFGVTMSAVDHFSSTIIDHYSDSWETVEKMVAQHCKNILKRLWDAEKERTDR